MLFQVGQTKRRSGVAFHVLHFVVRVSAMKAHAPPDFGTLFTKIKSRFDAPKYPRLICKQGFYTNCFVLKLQKATWTNDSMDEAQNRSGIFFSIWIEQESTQPNRVNYNIHALKLRELRGYKITSRDFAAEFRSKFACVRDAWPNVSTNYGPQTLMQGWITVTPGKHESEIAALMEHFATLTPMIDRLLEIRKTL
jgi:hypothetical protein